MKQGPKHPNFATYRFIETDPHEITGSERARRQIAREKRTIYRENRQKNRRKEESERKMEIDRLATVIS
jgi:hypothetical protein